MNGAPLSSVTTLPYTFAWRNAPPGITATARATDNFDRRPIRPVQTQIHLQARTYYHPISSNVIATDRRLGASRTQRATALRARDW